MIWKRIPKIFIFYWANKIKLNVLKIYLLTIMLRKINDFYV